MPDDALIETARPFNSAYRSESHHLEIKATFELFARHFVLAEFRARFVHEALKKPRKLHERICRRISEVLVPQCEDKTVPFTPDGPCLLIGWGEGIEVLTWSVAQRFVGIGGILIIVASGRKFHAETEGEPPIRTWAGSC